MGLKETALSMFIRETPFSHLVPIMDDMVIEIAISDAPDVGLVIASHDADEDYGESKQCCFEHATRRMVKTAHHLLEMDNTVGAEQGWELLEHLLRWRAEARPSIDLDNLPPDKVTH